MRPIDLNDLPKYSAWPERMLGLSSWTVTERNIEKTEKEYNKDKYFPCLEKFEEMNGNITMDEMKQFELGNDETEVCISIGDELFLGSFGDAKEMYYKHIKEVLASSIKKSTSVVELGAGYGYNLWMLQKEFDNKDITWIGGEYAENAILLGEKFAHKNNKKNISIKKFDFYEDCYRMLDDAVGPLTIFSVFGAQQLPTAKDILHGLRPHKDKIERVVYFESVYEHYDSATLLGQMRKRYIELCDYNRDMLTLLNESEDIEVLSERKNVIGLNPLLPLSVVEWKFSNK